MTTTKKPTEMTPREQEMQRLCAPTRFTAIPLARLCELRDNIHKSQGWSAVETPEERTAIVTEWNRMPGYYSFRSAVEQLIFEVENQRWECPYCEVPKSPEQFSETSDSCKDCESEDHLTPLRDIMSHFAPRAS